MGSGAGQTVTSRPEAPSGSCGGVAGRGYGPVGRYAGGVRSGGAARCPGGVVARGLAACRVGKYVLAVGGDRRPPAASSRYRRGQGGPDTAEQRGVPGRTALADAAQEAGRETLVAATRGADGVLLVDAEREQRVPAFAVDVVDTTGCGDAFLLHRRPPSSEGRLGPACAT